MFKLFQNITLVNYKRFLVGVCLVVLAAGMVIYWFSAVLAEEAVTVATQDRLLGEAKAAATSVESELAVVRALLVVLSDRGEVTGFNLPTARQILAEAIAAANSPVVRQMGLVASDGKLVVLATREGTGQDEGISLSDRDYFQWAKTARHGDVFLSKPVVARAGVNKGKWAVILATPVVRENEFAGVVYTSVRVADLTTGYIDVLKVDPSTVTYTINHEGIAVSSPFADMIGLNVEDYARQKKWSGFESYLAVVADMKAGKEERGNYFFMGSDGVVRHWLSGYAPVRVGRAPDFAVAVAAPYKQVDAVMGEFYQSRVLWLIFWVGIAVLLVFLGIAGIYIARQDGYNLGLKECYRQIKKKKI